MCALVLSIVGSFIGVTTPITIVQMLWLNMIMDTFAGIAFSYEAPLIEYMEEPPKKYFRLFPGNEVRLKGAYFITSEEKRYTDYE